MENLASMYKEQSGVLLYTDTDRDPTGRRESEEQVGVG